MPAGAQPSRGLYSGGNQGLSPWEAGAWRTAGGLPPAGPGHGSLDGLGERSGGPQRPPRDDELRDADGPPVLAEPKDHTGQLALGEAVDAVLGARSQAAVHAHVERTVGAEAEAALRVV